MPTVPGLAATAALFGDPARAAMLTALLDRPALSAGQLALAANISAQTASFHLAKLTSASLLVFTRRGRNQVYRLAGPAVAGALESLAAVSSAGTAQQKPDPLRAARTCYDHLAGIGGVLLHDALFMRGYLKANGAGEYACTAEGHSWFSELGGPEELLLRRSPFARPCMDWTEQKSHLAGRLAAFLLDQFFMNGWLARIRDTRAVRITEKGQRAFEREYGIHLKL